MIYYNIISTTPTELITLQQAKFQLRVDEIVNHEDSLILEYIAEAREIAENYIGRFIAQRDLEITSSSFITDIEKDYSPVSEIVSIKYKVDDVETTLPLDKYALRKISMNDKKIIYKTADLPEIDVSDDAVVTIVKVGYTVATCPKSIISAMKLILTRLYTYREDSPDEKQSASHNILRKFKKWA